MNGTKGIGRRRLLASTAMLFGAVFTLLLLPAYGQQDVAPDWYDPWAAPSAAVVHSAVHPAVPTAAIHLNLHPVPVALHQDQRTVTSLSPVAAPAKARVKDAKFDQSGHNAARSYCASVWGLGGDGTITRLICHLDCRWRPASDSVRRQARASFVFLYSSNFSRKRSRSFFCR